MKEIKLTQGQIAIVDDEDFDRINEFKWRAHIEGKFKDYFYAIAWTRGGSKNRKLIRMHRFVLNITNPKVFVDHINGNTLDNRKENLRIASHKENVRHLTKILISSNTSGFRGVTNRYNRSKKRPWESKIVLNGKNIYLGSFVTPEEAAKAYDEAAKKLFGEFCGKLNFE